MSTNKTTPSLLFDLSSLQHVFAFPAFFVPVNAYPSLIAGLSLLCISIYSLQIERRLWPRLARLALLSPTIYFFLDFGYGPYELPHSPRSQVAVGMAVIGLYGTIRALETCIVSLLDERPPYWISKDGKVLQPPATFAGRVFWTFDLATSLRGTSWRGDRYWDWCPRALTQPRFSDVPRRTFLRHACLSFPLQYLAVDALDTLNKSRTWDTSFSHPVTSLPLPEQLAFSLSVCAGTLLAITIMHTPLAAAAVALGASPASWPPMFDAPFGARSLADFWARRWHAIFRRVFARMSTFLMYPFPQLRTSKSVTASAVRAFVVFMLSASLHILIMARLQHIGSDQPVLNSSTYTFFLAQPAGLMLEALVIVPLALTMFPKSEGLRLVINRVWAWTFMLWAGRHWADVWVRRGMWQPEERVVGFSIVRGLLYNTWLV